jgi:hypothetical protein
VSEEELAQALYDLLSRAERHRDEGSFLIRGCQLNGAPMVIAVGVGKGASALYGLLRTHAKEDPRSPPMRPPGEPG